jgi:hypothetical protein
MSFGIAHAVVTGAELDGQGPVSVNAPVARDLLVQAQSRRIDIVCLGDSNQLFSGFGWQDGLTIALGEQYPMYATPILGAGDNNAIGLAISTIASPSLPPAGAPAALLSYNDPGFGVNATPYGFLPGGSTIPAGATIGMRLRPGNAIWPVNSFDADHALRLHFDYGTFETGPGETGAGAVFQPQLFQTGSFSLLHDPIDPVTGSSGIASSTLDMPAGIRNANDIVFRWFGSGVPDAAGPVFALYMRAEDLERPNGQSVSTLYGVGGATARDCALALRNTPGPQLRLFFERIRALQPSPRRILIRIAFGANDLTDSEPSVGPDGPFPADTDEAVADNIRAIIGEIHGVWSLAGWDPDELVFLLIGPHARLEAEPAGYGFRQAISGVALDAPNIAFVNHFRIAAWTTMLVDGWYTFPTGAHLNAFGYESMCRGEVEILLRSIASDLNGDCVVDTADLGILISAFGSSEPLGDINGDGIVDTADLGGLIVQFGESCDGP